MKRFIIDIETNGLVNPTVIWCVVVLDFDTKEVKRFLNREDFVCWLDTIGIDHIFIGHNIIDFDAKVIRDLWKIDLTGTCLDTLILSRLYSPKLRNGHSLEAWGQSLNFPKMEQPDFSTYSKDMVVYCEQDVKLTAEVYKFLMKEVGSWTWAIEIEHKVARALRDAKETGFHFDVPEAINLLRELQEKRDKYDDIIHAAYPPTEVGKRVKKLVPFNPNSPKQVIDKLWEAGWNPTERTKGHKDFLTKRKENTEEYKKKEDRFKKYGWRINETNLATLPEEAPEAAKSILKRTIYETRVRKLNEWLDLVSTDNCIHGDVISLGTWTHRMAHRHPNMANISAKKSIKYHTEELKEIATDLGGRMRALWTAKPGKVLVGTDAEGIQLRVLAHYMNDDEFIKAVTEGSKEDGTDPHSLNQRRIGRGTRDNAKTFIYAFLLGAGDGKIAEIYGLSRREGTDLKVTFVNSTPGLKKLRQERIPVEARQGYTIGFDGRRIYCDSEHLMMAAYLQGGEAIIMKLAVVLSVELLEKEKIPAKLINVIHDEMIFETQEEHAERVKEITEWSIKKAGELLNLNCPMKGEGNVGKNWLEVH